MIAASYSELANDYRLPAKDFFAISPQHLPLRR
jgi:hypothetical protein